MLKRDAQWAFQKSLSDAVAEHKHENQRWENKRRGALRNGNHFLNPSTGIINRIIAMLGGEPVAFLSKAEYFPMIYTLMNVWQNMGQQN